MKFAHLSCVAVLASALSPLAATTFTVGPPGSGAAFTDIQPAIDAAQPGDTILVLPGSYTSFTLTKALDVLGAGSGAVQVGSPAPIVVTGIPASEEAVLSGFTVIEHPTLHVLACAGSVTLHDVVEAVESDVAGGCLPVAGLLAQGAARVVVVSSTLRGMGGVAGDGLQAADSEIWLVDSEAYGGNGAPWGLGCTTQGGYGADLSNAALYVARSVLQAGYSQSIPFTPSFATNGITAAGGSFLKVVGGAGTTIEVGGTLGSFFPVAAIVLATGSSMLLQDQVSVVSYPGAPPFQLDGTSSASVTSTIYPTLAASALQASLGAPLSFDLTGNAGAAALLAYSPAAGPSALFPGIDGALALDIATVLPFATLAIGPGGMATLGLVVPPVPALVGTSAFFQALELGGPVQNAFSNPTLVSIL